MKEINRMHNAIECTHNVNLTREIFDDILNAEAATLRFEGKTDEATSAR